MVIQLTTLLLVSIYKQGIAVQPIDMPTEGYKTGWYVTELNSRQSMYLREPRREQVYIKQTIQTCMKN